MPVVGMTGKELAIERFSRGVTAIEVAKELGIHRSTLSSYENGWRQLPDGFAAEYLAALYRLGQKAAAK